tara:strand:- start:300 stop:599 length:300 start_codon:yes stop_codon:yes gene_type:complete
MKLICINDKVLKFKVGNTTFIKNGRGLKEGETYETNAEPFTDQYGELCYYIIGLGSKLVSRFSVALDQNTRVLSIEEKIQKAIDEEDYELAEILTKTKK